MFIAEESTAYQSNLIQINKCTMNIGMESNMEMNNNNAMTHLIDYQIFKFNTVAFLYETHPRGHIP